MTIQRCSERRVSSHSATYDSAFSDAAMRDLDVARFPLGHAAICDCEASDGKIEAKDCAGLTVSDPQGSKVARFEGKQFRVRQADDGGVIVYRLPVGQTKDKTLAQMTIADVQRFNEEFHAKK